MLGKEARHVLRAVENRRTLYNTLRAELDKYSFDEAIALLGIPAMDYWRLMDNYHCDYHTVDCLISCLNKLGLTVTIKVE